MKKNNIDIKKLKELEEAFDAVQMPRPPYVLKELVVNTRFTPEMQYHQCVLELCNAYDNLRTAECNLELKEIERKAIKTKGKKGYWMKKKLEVEMDQTRRAVLGAQREFNCLYAIFQSFEKKFTREEIDSAQPLEFKRKVETQAEMDRISTGTVSPGNLEGLRQIGHLIVQAALLEYKEEDKKFLKVGEK